ncbi:hypothetical protein CBL_08418 [Carabus blaptoides fortunei]
MSQNELLSITQSSKPKEVIESNKKLKRKNNEVEKNEFMRACTNALTSGNAEVTEYEAVGISVAKKLARMDASQAIYGEYLINNILKRGLLNTLHPHTDICDNLCSRTARAIPSNDTRSIYGESSYTSSDDLTQYNVLNNL